VIGKETFKSESVVQRPTLQVQLTHAEQSMPLDVELPAPHVAKTEKRCGAREDALTDLRGRIRVGSASGAGGGGCAERPERSRRADPRGAMRSSS